MSSTSDKIEGIGNQVAGRVKQAAGDLANKPELRQEGIGQENLGIAQKAVGDAKDTVKKIIDKV
jgi:uncharacterized protein YjbJ (UPF0337 family)